MMKDPVPKNTIIKTYYNACQTHYANLQGRLREFDKVIFLIRDNVKDAVISEVNSREIWI